MTTAKSKVPAPKTPVPKDTTDESDTKGSEPESDADDGQAGSPSLEDPTLGVPPAAPEPPKEKRSVKDRVRDAEVRWGKDFDEIILDIHDHVFGTSLPHDAVDKKEG